MIERFPTSGVFRLLRPRPATMRTIRACELPLRSTRAGSRTRRRRTRCAGRDLRYLRSGPRGCAGHGRTADRFQNGIPAGLPVSRPTTAFQLATYRQITPGASGEVRIDSLVKTQTVQIVQQAYTVEEPDIRATQVPYPMAQKAMGTGMYCPNRQSMLCSHKHCSFWKHCEEEFGGRIRSSELRPYAINAKRPARDAIAPGPGAFPPTENRGDCG